MLPSRVLRLHSSVRQQHRHLSSSPRLTSLHKAGRELTSATSTPDTPVTGACRFGKALHSPVTADDEAGAAGLLISWWPISDIPATLERHLTSEPDRRMPSISANHHHLGIGSSEKMDMQALESSMRSVNLGVEIWQGNAVFASTSTSQRLQTPKTPPPPSQARGSAASPISIHSSPSSPTKSPEPIAPLPRPRAIPHYSSPLPRTAYTPPRSRTLPFPSDSPSRVQPTQTQVQAHANGSDRPVHPFFARTLTRSRSSPVPPSPHKPRYVAEYSSTSESQSSSQQTQAGESTFGSQEDPLAQTGRAEAGSTRLEGVMARMRVAWAASGETGEEGGGVEEGVRKGGDGGFEEITSMIGNVDLTGKFADRPVERKEGVKKPEQKQLENTGAQKTMADQVEKGESVRSNLPARPGGPNAYIAAAQARTDTPTASATAAPVKPTSKAKAAPTRTTGTTRPTKSSSSTSGKASYSTSSTSTSSAFAAASSRLPTPPPAIDPSTLPFFSYRKYDKPPNVAYTTDPDEANDLLSCLKGPVLGLDLEWPMAGMYDTVDPRTGKSTKIRVGMTWDAATGRYKFGQGKVALVQLCDERMIVLVHLMHMKSLPSKVVEIMTDPKVYKSGVQVRGDGMKLVRDFPESFPNGVTNLLEVNNVARRVDPISMGPGARLVSLANLTERYLQCRLDKETRVRKSNWHMVLSGQQREYAANDVYVSLQLHLELAKLGITNNIHLTEDDLSRCSFNINSHGQALSGIARSPSPTGAGDSNSDSGNLSAEEGAAILARSLSNTAGNSGPSGYKPPTPAQIRAYESFRSGKSIKDIAADGGIRPATARGYVLSAVIGLRYGVRLLADQTGSNAPGAEEKEGAGISLSDEDKARLAKEMGSGGYMTAPQKVLMRALKAEVRLALGKDGRESGSDVSDVDCR